MNRRAYSALKGVALLLVLAALGAGAFWVVLAYARPLVTVTQTVQGPVVQAFYATGTVLPDREYPVRNNVEGILVEVAVDKGQAVTKGQVLAVIANDDLQFRLKQAQAELTECQKRADDKTSPVLQEYDAKMAALTDMLDIAKREEKRMADLMAKNAGTQEDLDHAMDRFKQVWSDMESQRAERAAKKLELQRELQVAQAALDIAQWDYNQQTIRSPVDGVVLDWPVSQGTRLAVNDHLMQIADVRPQNLLMRAQVDEEDKVSVEPGQTVHMTLYSFPDRVFTGTVAKIYAKADPDRRTFEVDVAFAEPDPALAAGMTGELAFVISAKDRVTVLPSQALQGGFVWAVRDGRLVKTHARIGLKSVERIEVLSGLADGDRVLISPIGSMQDGQSVRTKFMDPRQAAGLNKPQVDEARFKGFQG